jgi:DNA-binding transcriptional ArsR family regulator
MNKAGLMMHPVRMRILLALNHRTLTTRQISVELPDVATATLYHQLSLLTQAGLIHIVEERPVRGTVEKTYALAPNGGVLSAEDMAQMSHEDLLRSFQIFVSSLVTDFSRAIEQHEPGASSDIVSRIGYRQRPLYLNDEEFAQFIQTLQEAMKPWIELQDAPGRSRRLFSTIVFPLDEIPAKHEASPSLAESDRNEQHHE